MRRYQPLAFGAVLACIGASNAAIALDPSGTAVDVVPATAASGAGGSRALADNGPVFMGDVVATGARGSAQIKFVDNTKLVVGPNSQVTIDSFVFQNKTTAKSFSLNAVQGTFRFITGVSAKNVYSIKTPSATIGVRGTEFDFAVDRNGTHVGVWGGSVLLCNRGTPRRCTEISGQCSVVIMTPTQTRRIINGAERTAVMQDLFPYAFRQRRLQPEFRVDSGSCFVVDLSPGPSTGDSSTEAPPPSPDIAPPYPDGPG